MRQEKPTFIAYQEILGQIIAEVLGERPIFQQNWLQLAPLEVRQEILTRLKNYLESEYQVEQVIEPNWVNLDLSLESLSIRLHHVFSTVFLMERINDKIRARREN